MAIWLGGSLSALLLLVAGTTHLLGAWAVLCFLLTVLCLVLGFAGACWSKLWPLATGGGFVLMIILCCSVQPWYGEHGYVEDGGRLDIHRHSYWKIGHVH